MIQNFLISAPAQETKLVLERGFLKSGAVDRIKDFKRTVALITDDNVASLYAKPLCKALKQEKAACQIFSFPAGERNKSRSLKERLEDQLFRSGFGRDTVIVAIGGGVVTDLGGFLASTWCRGVPLILVPTTLLAMVDAAIGGKTGVNLPEVKNYIGTFYQPDSIFIDPAVLDTLKQETFCEGVVEMIKHSLIRDEEMFGWLERNMDGILQKEEKVLEKGIWESCQIKLDIVLKDPREAGLRRLLNFGHTIAHALEGVSKYRISHGSAVALGCMVEGYLSGLKESELQRMASLYSALKLPFERMLEETNFEELYQSMSRDKKGFRFVTLKKIGEAHSHEGAYCISIGKDQIFGALEWVRYRVGRSFLKPSALSHAVLDSDP